MADDDEDDTAAADADFNASNVFFTLDASIRSAEAGAGVSSTWRSWVRGNPFEIQPKSVVKHVRRCVSVT